MGEPWMPRWARTGLSPRGVLRRVGGAAVVAGYLSARGGGAQNEPLAQAATPATPAAANVPPDFKFKVVLHAAEEQDWVYVLSNLRNLTAEWPEARLRVVVDGSAVLMLQGQNILTTELGEVVAKGVELLVCPNALREHQIDSSTIPAYAHTTLGGVVALVLSQHEGYAYVKP